MKLADFFIKLGVVGDTKELDNALNKLEKAKRLEEKKAAFRQKILELNRQIALSNSKEEKDILKKMKLAERDSYVNSLRSDKKIDSLKKEKKGIEGTITAFRGAVAGITAFIGVATIAYNVIDRMASAFAQANQKMITFQRTTGLSFSSLNKYASASAAVNYNATIEGTAQSMQRVAQNLWDIRMGRGDISPYQELAYVGGRAFNPMGMSVEQVIENVREAIKGVNDLQATNIITRMGFSPDDLLMLRMSREEFEKINSLFLTPQQREAMNKYALELKRVQLEFNLLKEKALLKIMPDFVKLTSIITKMAKFWAEFASKIYDVIKGTDEVGFKISGLNGILKILAEAVKFVFLPLKDLYLIIEDIAYGMMGYDSYTKDFLDFLTELPTKINDAFDDSGIGQFFSNVKDGLQDLFNMTPPHWFIQLMSGNLASGLTLQLFKKLINNLNVNNDPPDLEAFANTEPVFAPSTISNNSSNTVNNNTQMDVSIATNQPMSGVINDLTNAYGFTQANYATGITT